MLVGQTLVFNTHINYSYFPNGFLCGDTLHLFYSYIKSCTIRICLAVSCLSCIKAVIGIMLFVYTYSLECFYWQWPNFAEVFANGLFSKRNYLFWSKTAHDPTQTSLTLFRQWTLFYTIWVFHICFIHKRHCEFQEYVNNWSNGHSYRHV